ncbi:hypothetical protein BRC78_00845, partial [Halobacteriales archaeon QH_8_68_33]
GADGGDGGDGGDGDGGGDGDDGGDDTPTETATSEGPTTTALSVPSLEFTFFARMQNAFDAAKEGGIISEDSSFYGANDNSSQQVSDLETAITNEVDFIMVSAIREDAVVSTVEDAVDQGIPVVAIDRNVASDTIATYVASDNVSLGERSTELLLQFMADQESKDTYNVVELQGTTGASVTNDRGEGFGNVVDENAVEVLGSQTGEFATQTALNVMEDFITQHGDDIDGAFCHNDLMALGVHQAVQGSDIGPIPITGIDGTEGWVELFGDNQYYSTIAQLPEEMVNTAIERGQTAVEGESLEDYYRIDGLEVTQDNATDYLDEYF